MIDVLSCAPVVALLTLLGLALDRALGLGFHRAGPGRWVLCTAAGLAAGYAFVLHPLLLIVLCVGAWFHARDARRDETPVVAMGGGRFLLAGLALFGVLASARPATPLYWDEFVWLGHARLESHAWGALRTAVLDPHAGLLPPGYPILWPLGAAWLAAPRTSPAALVEGACALRLLAAALWLVAVHGALREGRTARVRHAVVGALGVAALAPLVYVHLRASQVDLPVGLLAATVTLSLAQARDDGAARAATPLAALAAVLAVGAKDEGAAHVLAILLAALVTGSTRRHAGRGLWLMVLGAAALPFITWRWLLGVHGVTDADHALSAPAWSALPALGRALVRHASGVRTWGGFWALALAALARVAFAPRRASSAVRLAALALVGQAAALATGVVAGPDRVREFAVEGTLINRLLIQLVPAALVLLALLVRDALEERAPVRDGTAAAHEA